MVVVVAASMTVAVVAVVATVVATTLTATVAMIAVVAMAETTVVIAAAIVRIVAMTVATATTVAAMPEKIVAMTAATTAVTATMTTVAAALIAMVAAVAAVVMTVTAMIDVVAATSVTAMTVMVPVPASRLLRAMARLLLVPNLVRLTEVRPNRQSGKPGSVAVAANASSRRSSWALRGLSLHSPQSVMRLNLDFLNLWHLRHLVSLFLWACEHGGYHKKLRHMEFFVRQVIQGRKRHRRTCSLTFVSPLSYSTLISARKSTDGRTRARQSNRYSPLSR